MSFTKSTKFFIMGLLGAFLVGGVGAIVTVDAHLHSIPLKSEDFFKFKMEQTKGINYDTVWKPTIENLHEAKIKEGDRDYKKVPPRDVLLQETAPAFAVMHALKTWKEDEFSVGNNKESFLHRGWLKRFDWSPYPKQYEYTIPTMVIDNRLGLSYVMPFMPCMMATKAGSGLVFYSMGNEIKKGAKYTTHFYDITVVLAGRKNEVNAIDKELKGNPVIEKVAHGKALHEADLQFTLNGEATKYGIKMVGVKDKGNYKSILNKVVEPSLKALADKKSLPAIFTSVDKKFSLHLPTGWKYEGTDSKDKFFVFKNGAKYWKIQVVPSVTKIPYLKNSMPNIGSKKDYYNTIGLYFFSMIVIDEIIGKSIKSGATLNYIYYLVTVEPNGQTRQGVVAIGRLWEKHNKKIIPVILYCTLTPNGEGIASRYYYENDTVEERENAIAMATSLIAH